MTSAAHARRSPLFILNRSVRGRWWIRPVGLCGRRRLRRLCRGRRRPIGLRRLRRRRRRPIRLRRLRRCGRPGRLRGRRRCRSLLIPDRVTRRSRTRRGSRRRSRNLRPRFWLRLGYSCLLTRNCRLGCRRRLGRSVIVLHSGRLGRRLIALYQIRRHAGLRARHAIREQRLALALQFFLGLEYIRREDFGRVELTARRTSAEHEERRQRKAGSHNRGRRSRAHRFSPCRPHR
jgi:hypothetical protein